MKYAIISDIHSNLEALLAVLRDRELSNTDEIISLGDAVGYGASPNECIQLLIDKSVTSIIGNHDKVAAELEEPYNFNPVAREAVLWTRGMLSNENKEYIKSLPITRDFGSFIAVHGAVSSPDKYITGRFEAEPEYILMEDARVCFFGHTHVPAVYSSKNDYEYFPAAKLTLNHETKYLINPGSVGQPRDNDPRAAYIIYDTNEGTIEYKRVSYDIAVAKRKIMDAGLPEVLSERLSYGY